MPVTDLNPDAQAVASLARTILRQEAEAMAVLKKVLGTDAAFALSKLVSVNVAEFDFFMDQELTAHEWLKRRGLAE